MTCKDCIHYEPCFSGGVSMWNNIEQTKEDCCSHFKNKADFVEVVRCEECEHSRKIDGSKCPILSHCIVCECEKILSDGPMIYPKTHFCSYGERRDNND